MDDACAYCGTFLVKDVATGAAADIRENEGLAGAEGGLGIFPSPPFLDVCGIEGFATGLGIA